MTVAAINRRTVTLGEPDSEISQEPNNDWRVKIALVSIKIAVVAAVVITASFYISTYSLKSWEWGKERAQSAYAWALSKLPHSEKIRFIEPSKVSVETILDQVSDEMKFDRSVLRAIAMQESGGYTDTNRVKEEPHLLEPWVDRNGKKRAPQISPPAGLNKIEKLLWASSHGTLQVVFGFHYKECGLPENGWDQLHDPLINVRCGATVLKKYADKYRSSEKNPARRLWLALRDYNNSDAYADEVMARISKLRNVSYGEGL